MKITIRCLYHAGGFKHYQIEYMTTIGKLEIPLDGITCDEITTILAAIGMSINVGTYRRVDPKYLQECLIHPRAKSNWNNAIDTVLKVLLNKPK